MGNGIIRQKKGKRNCEKHVKSQRTVILSKKRTFQGEIDCLSDL